MKKAFFLALATFLIASCGSSTPSDDTKTKTYEGNGFSMTIPISWVKVEDTQLPKPKGGNVELGLQSAEIGQGFVNNLNILSEKVLERTTSINYGITNNVRNGMSMNQYQPITSSDFDFSDKEPGKIYEFEAKYTNETPVQYFFQVAKICEDRAYLVTIGINLEWKKNHGTTQYQNLLKSFKCKAL